ncbi:MAG: hypothetical protein ACOZEN_02595 [Thermodesulfobacteriota bacterium]
MVGIAFAAWLLLLAAGAAFRTAQPEKPAGQGALALVQAGRMLDAMRDASGSYPSTGGRWVLVAGEALSASAHDPKGLAERLATAPAWDGVPRSALIYRSDGRDFKLVRHAPQDCTAMHAREPALVDPVRTAYSRRMIPGGWEAVNPGEQRVAPLKDPMLRQDTDIPDSLFGECWAYGVWTPGAVFW